MLFTLLVRATLQAKNMLLMGGTFVVPLIAAHCDTWLSERVNRPYRSKVGLLIPARKAYYRKCVDLLVITE